MKRKHKILLAIVLFVLGLCIFLYPTISSRWNAHRERLLVADYQQTVDSTDDTSLDEELVKAQEYNASLVGTDIHEILPAYDGKEDGAYEALLNPGDDGIMGSVEIPVIRVNLPIYHYTTDEVLSKGAGHLVGTSLPVGGKGTHAVISAHRGLPTARLFTDLDKLQTGDVFYIHVLHQDLAYEVDQIKTVDPDDISDLAIDKDQDYVTLLTCTPYGVNTQRLLVRGHRIEMESAAKIEESKTPRAVAFHDPNLPTTILCALIGVAAGIGIVVLLRGTRRRREIRQDARKETKEVKKE